MIECPDLSRVLVYPLGKVRSACVSGCRRQLTAKPGAALQVVAYDAASIDEAVHSVAEAVKIVQDSGYAVSPTDTAVENIVATFKLGRPVDLEVLSAERYDDVTVSTLLGVPRRGCWIAKECSFCGDDVFFFLSSTSVVVALLV